jgi:hypothetical protein
MTISWGMKMRRYSGKAREQRNARCYDCGLDYRKFPCDMIIDDVLWELIKPCHYKGAGLLCPNCICRRLMKLPHMVCVTVNVDMAISTGSD